jgi:uncharacterized membrane-anchored protein
MAGEARRCANCFAGGFGGILFVIAIILFLVGLFALFNGGVGAGLVFIILAAVPGLIALHILRTPKKDESPREKVEIKFHDK